MAQALSSFLARREPELFDLNQSEGILVIHTFLTEIKNSGPKDGNSANHDLINSLGLYIAYAPIWNLPATFPYCCPTTVLEWKTGHDTVLPPVVFPESLIFHVPALRL